MATPCTLKEVGGSKKKGQQPLLAAKETFGLVEFHFDILAKRLGSCLFKQWREIALIDHRNGKEENFAFSGGLKVLSNT